MKNTCTQGPGAHFSARVQDLDLVLGHRDRARILARVLKKRCVHISAHRGPYSGTGARAPSVNAPLENCPPPPPGRNKGLVPYLPIG